jgi:MFS family permease
MALGLRMGPSLRLLPLVSLSVAAAGFELAGGFFYPAIALNLELRGASADLIGYQAAMVGLGLALSPLLVPWLIARCGMFVLCAANFALAGGSILAFGLNASIGLWFAFGLVFGISTSIWYVQSETWLNRLATDASRGRAVGLFGTLREGGLALGPLLVPVLGCTGLLPYASMALVIVLAGLPLCMLGDDAERRPPPRLCDFIGIARVIPVLLIAALVGAYFDGSVLPLWVVYGLEQGLSSDQAMVTLSLIKLGNIALQLPIGWLADRSSRTSVLLACVAATGLGAVLLPAIDLGGWLAWPYLLIWGASSFGIYTTSLVLIGERLGGSRLVVATAAFGVMWGLGALGGSAITGWLMATLGAVGLPVSITAVCALMAAVLIGQAWPKRLVAGRPGLAGSMRATLD